MTLAQKLQIIQRLSALNQTALAAKLGVTFVALNRWMNGRAIPHPKAQERIDALYREYSGLTVIPSDVLEAKKKIVFAKALRGKSVLQTMLNHHDIRDQFVLTLTYTSNSIEGSTLTEAETAVVLFHNATLPNKTLVEQLEAKNHQTALLKLFQVLSEQKKPLDEDLVLHLHGILMNGIRHDAGSYRQHGVRIVGANLATANYLKVPILMKELVEDFSRRTTDVIAHTADIHARFEKIHPFSDGNGRVGRLLMHAMLLKRNIVPVIIKPEQKRLYYAYLNTAQRKEDSSLLQDFFCDCILEGWNILESPI